MEADAASNSVISPATDDVNDNQAEGNGNPELDNPFSELFPSALLEDEGVMWELWNCCHSVNSKDVSVIPATTLFELVDYFHRAIVDDLADVIDSYISDLGVNPHLMEGVSNDIMREFRQEFSTQSVGNEVLSALTGKTVTVRKRGWKQETKEEADQKLPDITRLQFSKIHNTMKSIMLDRMIDLMCKHLTEPQLKGDEALNFRK